MSDHGPLFDPTTTLYYYTITRHFRYFWRDLHRPRPGGGAMCGYATGHLITGLACRRIIQEARGRNFALISYGHGHVCFLSWLGFAADAKF